MKFYFAHSYEIHKMGHPNKNRIINNLKERGVEVYDPFSEEKKLLKKHGVNEYYENPKYHLARDLWTKDIGAIIKCDGILAWLPKDICASGTAQEIVIGYYEHKFIQVISERKLHPSLSVYADQIFLTVDDYINNRRYYWE